MQLKISSKTRGSLDLQKLEFLQLRSLPDEERLQNATFRECNSADPRLKNFK
jgi:hypothetical protein